MNIEELQARKEAVVGDLDVMARQIHELIEFINDEYSRLQEMHERARDYTINGTEAARMLGYERQAFYNARRDKLRPKGWLIGNRHSYLEVMKIKDYKDKHGTISTIPCKPGHRISNNT